MSDFETSTTIDSGSASSAPVNDGGSAAPTTVDLTDDSLIRHPAYKDPVKFSDLSKRFQADYTRKTTDFARQKEQYENEHKSRLAQVEQKEQYLRNLAATLLQRQEAAGRGNSVLDEIKSLPYIDGETAYKLLSQIQNEGFGGVTQAIQQRDQVIKHLYNQISELSKVVQGLNSARVDQSFDGKIRNYVKQLDLPEEAFDLAKEIYLAYEGDDLDQEFPSILQKRWESVANAIRTIDKKRIESAKPTKPFPIAGKGGQGSPSKGARGLKGSENAKQTADFLWDVLNAGEKT